MEETQGKPASKLMVLESFGKAKQVSLEVYNIEYALSRLVDAKTVNPITYPELEHVFNEAYRDLKKAISQVGYLLTQAQKSMEDAKADVILGSYKAYITEYPKEANADTRNAFLTRDDAYAAALDRIAQMKALESNFDGKIKVMENVCRYMRKQMDLVLRSGMSAKDYYNTQNQRR